MTFPPFPLFEEAEKRQLSLECATSSTAIEQFARLPDFSGGRADTLLFREPCGFHEEVAVVNGFVGWFGSTSVSTGL